MTPDMKEQIRQCMDHLAKGQTLKALRAMGYAQAAIDAAQIARSQGG